MLDHNKLATDIYEYSKEKIKVTNGLIPFAVFIKGSELTPLFLREAETPHECQLQLYEFASQIDADALIFSSLVVLSKHEDREGYSILVNREVLLTQYSSHTSEFSQVIQGNIKIYNDGSREVVQTRIHNKVDISESQKFLQSL